VNWDQRPDHLFEAIDCLVATGAGDLLVVTTSMHDLVVAVKPVDDPPHDVVVVRAPGSLLAAKQGSIRIEHLVVPGHDTAIDRPVEEAVRLLRRLVDTEFGIRPDLLRSS
jgi:hypothetical protein